MHAKPKSGCNNHLKWLVKQLPGIMFDQLLMD